MFLEIGIGIVVYLSVNAFLDRQQLDVSAHRWFTSTVLAHNLGLMAYSAWTFQQSTAILSTMTWNAVMHPTADHTALYYPAFMRIAYIFYLSKYYEFIDTWIHYLKGRRPVFLQVYHHTGAVILMGLGVMYKCHGVWVFVVFNSFVHTVMYGYYALSTLRFRVPFKHYITALQILQLVTGILFAFYYLWFTSQTPEQTMCIRLKIVYLVGLIYLFSDFYLKTYRFEKCI